MIVTSELVRLFIHVWNQHNDTYRQVHKETINLGWCYQFAILLRHLHGPHVELWTDDYDHAWIKVNGKFYDSDTPQGVTNFRELKCRPRGSRARQLEEEEAVKLWRTGGSGEVQYSVIKEVISLYRRSVA